MVRWRVGAWPQCPHRVLLTHLRLWAESLRVEFFSCELFSSSSLAKKRRAASCWAESEAELPFFRVSTTSASFSTSVFFPCSRRLLNAAQLEKLVSDSALTSDL